MTLIIDIALSGFTATVLSASARIFLYRSEREHETAMKASATNMKSNFFIVSAKIRKMFLRRNILSN